MPIYSSDSDMCPATLKGCVGRQKPLHALLGGGKVADVLLWRKRKLISSNTNWNSPILWFLLFEVVEYNFVTLLCHIFISTMLIVFVWSTGAGLIDWNPPDPLALTIPESTVRWLFAKFNTILLRFYYVSSGRDLKTFILAIAILWIISGIGNYFSSLNLLYTGFLCLITLPALYERYQDQVDYLASKGNRDMKKLYKKLDAKFLNKIPRGPVKERKKF
ncbi:Reticulon-like protein B14 [Sesamum alatum]|uniref:Reticulon-like protein n=1 Tax=Sesamum alatum TaxID=300844 RepID=A0AAE1Y556_9LAMI|nr:Reticulon-like protein B14 [Sesamum alatum]